MKACSTMVHEGECDRVVAPLVRQSPHGIVCQAWPHLHGHRLPPLPRRVPRDRDVHRVRLQRHDPAGPPGRVSAPRHAHTRVADERPELCHHSGGSVRTRDEIAIHQNSLLVPCDLQPLPRATRSEYFASFHDCLCASCRTASCHEVHEVHDLVVLPLEVGNESRIDSARRRQQRSSIGPKSTKNRLWQAKRVRVRHRQAQPFAPPAAPRPVGGHEEEAEGHRVQSSSTRRPTLEGFPLLVLLPGQPPHRPRRTEEVALTARRPRVRGRHCRRRRHVSRLPCEPMRQHSAATF
mmetsp:Transcript_95816/g.257554  ORF Transcript_95816/g.257554 Transcript_95816/m.257554 type:complete len:293 (-) Transcript_95816:484-1362(-)